MSRTKAAVNTHPASLVIRGAGDMTPKGRRLIADWLRMHADDLIRDGANYSRRFRGRYITTGRTQ